ncbi:MAG UNVERIFIED_CONTAM: hypothetical protein LVR29_28815 [Microcystis novacekii LVE1205-3]
MRHSPANLVAASARIAKSLIPMLQGVMVLNPLAMPMIGLLKSFIPKTYRS